MDWTPKPSERFTLTVRKWALLGLFTWLWWILLAGLIALGPCSLTTILTFGLLIPGGIGLLAWWLINMEFNRLEI